MSQPNPSYPIVIPERSGDGQRDRALDALESMAERAPGVFAHAQCYEEVRSLEGDPRYERLLERVGLPAR